VFGKIGEEVQWVVEQNGILVVSERTGESLRLNQTESAVWQLYSVEVILEEICQFLAALQNEPQDVAEQLITDLLQRWKKIGFLESRA
jgi:hypothetical protein